MNTLLLVPDPDWLRMCYPKITMRTTSKLWLIQSPTTHPPKYSRVWFWCAVYLYHIYLITIMHGYTSSLEGHEANIVFAAHCNARPSGMCPVARHATSLVSSAWTTPTSSRRSNLNGPLLNYERQCVTGKRCLCFVVWTCIFVIYTLLDMWCLHIDCMDCTNSIHTTAPTQLQRFKGTLVKQHLEIYPFTILCNYILWIHTSSC